MCDRFQTWFSLKKKKSHEAIVIELSLVTVGNFPGQSIAQISAESAHCGGGQTL